MAGPQSAAICTAPYQPGASTAIVRILDIGRHAKYPQGASLATAALRPPATGVGRWGPASEDTGPFAGIHQPESGVAIEVEATKVSMEAEVTDPAPCTVYPLGSEQTHER